MIGLKDIALPVINDLRAGRKTIAVSELWGSSKALFLFAMQREANRPLLVVTTTEDEANALFNDLVFFSENASLFSIKDPLPSSMLFPPWGVLPFEASSPDSRTVGERMRFLHELTSSRQCIFVAPLASFLQKLPPWNLFADSVRNVRIGVNNDPDIFIELLVSAGYEQTSLVTRVGEFSRRGGIIDFFSPSRERPIRMELFGDVVESLREFDVETQRSVSAIDEAVLLPVRELIVTSEGLDRISNVSGIGSLAEQIESGILPPGSEFLSPFFYEMDSLFSYLPEDSIIALIEPDDITIHTIKMLDKIREGLSEESGSSGRVLPRVSELYLGKQEIDDALSRFQVLQVRLLGLDPQRYSMDTKSSAWLGVRLTRTVTVTESRNLLPEGTASGLADKLRSWQTSNRVVLVCGTSESCRRFRNLFTEYGLALFSDGAQYSGDSGVVPITVVAGRLSQGFAWPRIGRIIITEEDIFGEKTHISRGSGSRSKAAPFLTSFRELKPGDFVVHRDYGVGEYQGLSHISVDGFETDFLTLRYEPDAKLYVPLYSLDKVQKYIGTEGMTPKLNRLGAPSWTRTKEKVQKDILAMARDLVTIYAARESLERASFSPPDNLYQEFAAAFPYEETHDQERAIEDVLTDMQRTRPMDRLVCGDVGYGKTEVALRAAFKVVEDGRQVAVLVPTTLLADQHYRTFTERLSSFPVRVEMLSRFRSKAEQSNTIRGLKTGTVDVVIGTHRLLQKDVAFGNLGLLVVDEEHRFGVSHKERIKGFKKLVDVLTLTATPIPRTLHLSLSGLRDLSIIQTPPLDRQAIQIVLARFGARVIREAILRELDRGGQVFFVQNRVQGIDRMSDFIRNIVPTARVGVAHGQMDSDAIEKVMSDFVEGNISVLVTTSIIESGIDIPNANTIIINRADRFGLAELYQIKGRVGRSGRKAYAYLLTPAEEVLSELARRRLRAIQELSELGAGFRIAAQDLEARGAGNLLGKQQSGHIAAVGIDLYTEMMEEAVKELRGEEIMREPDTQINLKISAFIPDDYIEDVSLRLAAYKEISCAADDDVVDRIAADLRDRYGPMPEPAQNLLEIMRIKIEASRSLVSRIDRGTTFVNITFSEYSRISPERILAVLRKHGNWMRLVQEYTLQLSLGDNSLQTVVAAVKKCLQAFR